MSFSIADGMSSSGNIMCMAARELNAEAQIFVVDSANLSTGIGLLVIEATIMAQNGRSALKIHPKILVSGGRHASWLRFAVLTDMPNVSLVSPSLHNQDPSDNPAGSEPTA